MTSASHVGPIEFGTPPPESQTRSLDALVDGEEGDMEKAAMPMDGLLLQLSDEATADEKHLLRLHQKYSMEMPKGVWKVHAHPNYPHGKAKGMWDLIAEEYGKAEGRSTASLQMKLGRAIRNYAIWPQSEDEILVEAFNEVTAVYEVQRQQSYRLVIYTMKLMGGCRIHNWGPSDIQARLAKLGLIGMDTKTMAKRGIKSIKSLERRRQKQKHVQADEKTMVRKRARTTASQHSPEQEHKVCQQLDDWEDAEGGAPGREEAAVLKTCSAFSP